jgi:hypothetical protein
MLCLSHTHAGPVLSLHEHDKPGSELIESYLEALAQSAIDATRQALKEAQPRILDWSYGHCTWPPIVICPNPAQIESSLVSIRKA